MSHQTSIMSSSISLGLLLLFIPLSKVLAYFRLPLFSLLYPSRWSFGRALPLPSDAHVTAKSQSFLSSCRSIWPSSSQKNTFTKGKIDSSIDSVNLDGEQSRTERTVYPGLVIIVFRTTGYTCRNTEQII